MPPDRIWQEHEGRLTPVWDGTAVEHDNKIINAHLRCRRPLLWALLGVALVGLTTWLTGISVWGASMASDLKVNENQHKQLDATLQEMRQDLKELLKRTAGGP